MKRAITRVANFIQGSPLLEFALGFVIVLVGIWGSYGAFTVAKDIYYASRPYTDFFNYRSVSYIERDGDSLVFASTRIVKRADPMVYIDVLFCDNGRSYTFYSSQPTETSEPRLSTELRTVEWSYNSPFPIGRTCYLESQVTMTVEGKPKEQIIKSDEFIIK